MMISTVKVKTFLNQILLKINNRLNKPKYRLCKCHTVFYNFPVKVYFMIAQNIMWQIMKFDNLRRNKKHPCFSIGKISIPL